MNMTSTIETPTADAPLDGRIKLREAKIAKLEAAMAGTEAELSVAKARLNAVEVLFRPVIETICAEQIDIAMEAMDISSLIDNAYPTVVTEDNVYEYAVTEDDLKEKVVDVISNLDFSIEVN